MQEKFPPSLGNAGGPYGVPIHVFSRVFGHFSGFSKNFATPKSKISVYFSLCDMVKKNFFFGRKNYNISISDFTHDLCTF